MVQKAQKFVAEHGLLIAEETTAYGTYASPSAPGDAIYVDEPVVVLPQYEDDGARTPEAGGAGTYPPSGKSGRFAEFDIATVVRGAGSAYSSSVFPLDIHLLLLACGHDVTTDSTTNSEKQTYSPNSQDSTSVSVEAYSRGEFMQLAGALGSLQIEIDGNGYGVATASFMSLVSQMPQDISSFPDLSGIGSQQAPKGESMTVEIGNYTSPRVRAVRFNQNREVVPRVDTTEADGHGGFAAVAREPTLEVDIEAETLSTSSPYHASDKINPYELEDRATQVTAKAHLGSNQYNRMKISGDQAVVQDVSEQDFNGVAGWTLTFGMHQSNPQQDDDYSVVFD